MRRILFICLIVALGLLRVTIVHAAGPDSLWATDVIVSSSASPGTPPVIEMTRAGQVRLAWYGGGQILLTSPMQRWHQSVSPQDDQADISRLQLIEGYFIWEEITATGRTVYSTKLEEPAALRQFTFPDNAVYAATPDGDIIAAWADGPRITLSSSNPLVRLTLDLASPPLEPMVTSDAFGDVHLVWRQESADPLNQGIFLLSPYSSAFPVKIAEAGTRPQIMVTRDKRIHVLYILNNTLIYAHSEAWSSPVVVAEMSTANVPFAIAPGDDNLVHLVWSDDSTIFYANSGDWEHSRQTLTTEGRTASVAIASGMYGQVHIAYTSITEEGLWQVHYLQPNLAPFQLRIVPYLDDEFISASSTISAYSNLPPAQVLRVSFYLSLQRGESALRTIVALGQDTDGTDGWTIALTAPDSRPREVQACALATAYDGRQSEVCSGVFTLLPDGWPMLWLDSPAQVAGKQLVSAYYQTSRFSQMDLWAQPEACVLGRLRCPADGLTQYLGRVDLVADRLSEYARQILAPDASLLSEGYYRLSASLVSENEILTHTLQAPYLVQHTVPPVIEVRVSDTDISVGSMLEISARVTEGESQLTHIDYYLVEPGSQPAAELRKLELPRERWVGAATVEEGWRVKVPANPDWLGEDWLVKAIAYDSNDQITITYSPDPLTIRSSRFPHAEFIAPAGGTVVSGTVEVIVQPEPQISPQDNIELYVRNHFGSWTKLGDMTNADGVWKFELDTRRLANGSCTLMALVRIASSYITQPTIYTLQVDNGSQFYAFSTPLAGSLVSGTVRISITSLQPVSDTLSARLYIEDEAHSHWEIGERLPENGMFTFAWNSLTVMDGPYTLTAEITIGDEEREYISIPVTVSNITPQVRFSGIKLPAVISGTQEVCWQAIGASGIDSVSLDYSPDNGARWLPVSSALPEEGCIQWDTTPLPDSTRGRLRLTAVRTYATIRVLGNPFTLNNIIENPIIAFITPRSGNITEPFVRIGWQSWSPDASELLVELSYRVPGAAWQIIDSNLPAEGEYYWEYNGAEPFELRAIAQSREGATGLAEVTGLYAMPSVPLSIRLFSPQGGEALSSEALVLWNVVSANSEPVAIDLYFSDNAGLAWLPLAEDLSDSGNYVWQLAFLPPGDQYRVKVVARTSSQRAYSASSGTFSIGSFDPYKLEWLEPAPSEELTGLVLVRWLVTTRMRDARVFNLSYRLKGQDLWYSLAQNMPDDGAYIWDTTSLSDGDYELRLQILDRHGKRLQERIMPVSLSNNRNHPPVLEILSPVTGELTGGREPVRWRAYDRDGDKLDLIISRPGDDGTWEVIDTIDAAQGLHYLTEDTHAVGALRLDITDGTATDHVELQTHSAPEEPTLAMVPTETPLPVTGRLAWYAQDRLGSPRAVNVYASENNGASWVLQEQGYYGCSLSLGADRFSFGVPYQLRVELSGRLQEVLPSVQLFTPLPLFQHPILEAQLPTQPITWAGQHEITWQTDDPLGRSLSIKVDISSNGGLAWTSLSTNAETTGAFTIDTSKFTNGIYLLRVTADNQRMKTTRISAPITFANPGLAPPTISLRRPFPDDTLSGSRTVNWVTADASEIDPWLISIYYSADGGREWLPIVNSLADTGIYNLDTSILPNSEQLWLMAVVARGSLMGQDLSEGPVRAFNPRNPTISLSVTDIHTLHPLISWETGWSSRLIPVVSLYYSLETELRWVPIAEALPASGSLEWDAGQFQGLPLLIKATAADDRGTAVEIRRFTLHPVDTLQLLPFLP